MRINQDLRKAISENCPAAELMAMVDSSFINMRADGIQKAARGLTTIEEVLRATQDTDDIVV